MTVDEIIADNNLHRTEGVTGVQNLARLCNHLGYSDSQRFGQFLGGDYGTLIHFLEDNAKAVEVILDYIRENQEDWGLGEEEELEEEEEQAGEHKLECRCCECMGEASYK